MENADALIAAKIQGLLSFRDFCRSRLVCRLWARASYLVTAQWYNNWVRLGGPCEFGRGGHIRSYMATYGCTDETCGKKHHYLQIKTPKLLKTWPVHLQLFRYLAQKSLRRARSAEREYEDQVERVSALYESSIRLHREAATRATALEADVAKLEQQFVHRKRRRIDVSKLTCKDE